MNNNESFFDVNIKNSMCKFNDVEAFKYIIDIYIDVPKERC